MLNSKGWGSKHPEHLFRVGLVASVIFFIATYFLAMFIGPMLFFFTPEGVVASRLDLQFFPIMLFSIVFFYIPASINVGLLFSLLWGIYLLCFFAAWKYRESLKITVENMLSHSPADAFKNCLFAVPIISSAVLVSAVSITLLEAIGGISSGEPPLPEDPFQAYILLTLAPLVEEIGFRLTPIGTFLAVYLFWHRGMEKTPISRMEHLKVSATAFLYPEKAKRMTGTRNVSEYGVLGGISSGEWLIIVLTAISFGLAHILGGGWEIGKVTSTSLQGFALGVTYLLYGIQAPILLHWFFNYYSYTYILAADIYPFLGPLSSLINITTFAFGTLGLLALAVSLISRIRRKGGQREQRQCQDTEDS